MNLLFDNFEILADAPGRVKKLREMILQLAVQGKLVPQDPKDEPAKERIKKIKSLCIKEYYQSVELARKNGERKPKKPINLTFWEINPDVLITDKKIPLNWVETYFINLCVLQRGYDLPKSEMKTGVYPVASSGGVLGYHNEFKAKGPGVYTGRSGSVGKVHFIESDYWPHNTTLYVKYFLGNYEKYVYCVLKAFGIGDFSSSTAVATLNRNRLFMMKVKIPPLNEQKRIVAKVDKLMVLCDNLEKQQQEKAKKRLTLNKASLNALNNSTTKQEFNQNWNHITRNFDLLYSTPENVKELKQSILQLAVQGKLVPQDTNDEPASALLDKINKEKERLVKDGKIKKQKPLPPITDDEKPFEVPKGWEWCRLGKIIISANDGPHFSPTYADNGIPFISTRNISPTGVDFTSSKFITPVYHEEISRRCKPEKWDILYTKGGTTGIARVNSYDVEFNVWVHVAVLKKPTEMNPYYIQCLLNSPHCYDQSQTLTHGIGNKDLGLTRMVTITTPLPPIAEQKRIVAKVDKLMALCDNLSKSLADKEDKNEKLINAVVNQL